MQSEHVEESPFDVFWQVTSEIMDNLSQPMSFQSAAMAAFDAMENRSNPGAQAALSNGDSSKSKDAMPSKLQGHSRPPHNAASDTQDLDDDGERHATKAEIY